MARIGKADHPAILKAVDEDRRPVAMVAAEYGCTPANLYALLRRLRAAPAAPPPLPAAPPAPAPAAKPPVDLFASAPEPAPRPVAEAPRPVGARLAKPGFGLVMRTGDGEETMAPFRSLDELLGAVKPILRAAARDPEPVWFSIQPVDLATVEFDAA